MKCRNILQSSCLLALAVALLAPSGRGADVIVRDGARSWRFVEVSGTSRLPLQFLRTGRDEERLDPVALPRYWIATQPITEGDFAAVMGRTARSGRPVDRPACDIEWAEAQTFCERFALAYATQLPKNALVSIPSMLEWAHAVRVLEGRDDLGAEVGTFLFTGSQQGGFLQSYWNGAADLRDARDANVALSCRFLAVPKRCKSSRVGLRPVLVDVDCEQLGDNPVVTRGVVALQHGFTDLARQYLELARRRGSLSEQNRARADHALDYARHDHPADLEDWSGLVACAAATASARGFATEPYATTWQRLGWDDTTNSVCIAAYRKAGVYGGWLPAMDLPLDIRTQQVARDNPRVQIVSCEFTGDGHGDLVVERYGQVGANGYWYDFYARQPNGGYAKVYAVQTAGLCVLPREDGGPCGFLTVDKQSDRLLTVRLVWYENGRMADLAAHPRPFVMLDAKPDRVYRPAPFIGGGDGLGWRILEERGIWYRPVFWPWKPGTVSR